jgi:hypothetical protein
MRNDIRWPWKSWEPEVKEVPPMPKVPQKLVKKTLAECSVHVDVEVARHKDLYAGETLWKKIYNWIKNL